MKIDDSTNERIPPKLSQSQGKEAREKRQAEVQAARGNNQPAEFEEASECSPARDRDRTGYVASIRSKINQGTYKIDSYAVAGKFLRAALIG